MRWGRGTSSARRAPSKVRPGRSRYDCCSRAERIQHTWCSATDRRPDIAYYRALLSTGVMLEYDHHFRSHLEDGTCPAADLITTLAPEFPAQTVGGMDMARRSYWHGHGGKPGLVWLLTLLPTLLRERGVKHEPRNNPVREVLIQ